MVGYAALGKAWATISPPACAGVFHAGMLLAYGVYGGNALGILNVLDQGQSIATALTVDLDLPPILRTGRLTVVSRKTAMMAWGATQQAIDVGTADRFFDSLGFAGLDALNLGSFAVLYQRSGASTTDAEDALNSLAAGTC